MRFQFRSRFPSHVGHHVVLVRRIVDVASRRNRICGQCIGYHNTLHWVSYLIVSNIHTGGKPVFLLPWYTEEVAQEIMTLMSKHGCILMKTYYIFMYYDT